MRIEDYNDALELFQDWLEIEEQYARDGDLLFMVNRIGDIRVCLKGSDVPIYSGTDFYSAVMAWRRNGGFLLSLGGIEE